MTAPTNYNKIKVGVKTLDDAVLSLGSLNESGSGRIGKRDVIQALASQNIEELRHLSNFFYKTNGVYQKVCNSFSTMYRYDWYIVSEKYDDKNPGKEEKITNDFKRVLRFLDNSYIKQRCAEIALKVIKDGVYYGYVVESDNFLTIQELPVQYCRTRYYVGAKPAVEFNMRFFDEKFTDINYRMRVLKLFPPEFAKGYVLYRQGKLAPDFCGDTSGSWYLLDPEKTARFALTDSEAPLFVNAIPAILDLDAAQDLDRRKQMQKLLKIIVQKLPMDKNGDLIFDVDEAKDIHNNAVEMLRRAVGVDVLTTFADIESIDMSDKNTTATQDDLQKVERTVFNALGVSQNLFNTDGNMALEKSVLKDEGQMRTLVLQFAVFFDRVVQQLSGSKKKYGFRFYMLETTQFNYKELSKMYKEQTQLGNSKILPQLALGHSQSSIINTAYFENEVLHLNEIMIPPLMSSTMNSEDILGKNGKSGGQNSQNIVGEEKEPGRPEKPDDQKSEKTIQNKEAMS